MIESFEPEGSTMTFQHHRPEDAAPSPGFDSEVFRGFINLLGPAQALFWLKDFRDELCKVFGFPPAPPQTTVPSRDFIHHLCGRTGIMGFRGLHNACHAFLECGAGQDVPEAVFQRVRAEAEIALEEVTRQIALLT